MGIFSAPFGVMYLLIISVSSLHFLNKFGISALHIVVFRLTYLEAVVLSFNVKQTEYIFIT